MTSEIRFMGFTHAVIGIVMVAMAMIFYTGSRQSDQIKVQRKWSWNEIYMETLSMFTLCTLLQDHYLYIFILRNV